MTAAHGKTVPRRAEAVGALAVREGSPGRAASLTVAAALAALAGAGCDVPYQYSTLIAVRDPSRVAVHATPTGASSPADEPTVLPEHRGPAVVDLPPRTVTAGPESSATYRLQLSRDGDGAIALHATTSLPVTSGDTYRLLGADGRVVPLESDEDPATRPLGRGPVVAFDACANVHRDTHRYGATDYSITIDPMCSLESLERVELVTRRDNLVEIKTTRTVPSSYRTVAAISLFGGMTPALIAGGILMAVLVPNHIVGYGVGVPLMGLGATLGVFKLRVIFAPDTTTVVYP
jgi:hypothetical protein